jgi:preprotein translocase subunit SecF
MPLHLLPNKTHFDFMGKRWVGFTVSIILTLLSLTLVFTKGLNLGIDFTGGILMEIHTEKPADLSMLRESLNNQRFGEVSLQNMGSERDMLIRIQLSKDEEQSKIVARLKDVLNTQTGQTIDYRKIDYVGPTMGSELVENGIWAVVCAFGAILLYLWYRFEWQYGVGAVISLLHNSIMLFGFFAVSRFEFGATSIAAILTVVGYSVNDTVVIYDRIRENMRRFKKMEVSELLNTSINDTLSRTILTVTTVLLAALSLAIFGGEVIRGLSTAIVFGVIVGTYSSIYIASPMLIYLNIRPKVIA